MFFISINSNVRIIYIYRNKFISWTKNIFFLHNYIIISNTNTFPHCDGIQSYKDKDLDIYNNYIEQDNSKSSNAQGVYISYPDSGYKFRIWNNIFNHTQSSSNGFTVRGLGHSYSAEIIGNVVYGENSSDHGIQVTESTENPIIKNNIIQYVGMAGSGFTITGMGNFNETSHNIQVGVYSIKGTNAITSNPLFINPINRDFGLQPGSPGIDAGIELSSPYNVDINGISRPQFEGFDIGAHENSNRLPVLEPILNQNLNEGDSLEVSITATDPDGDNISLTVENLPVFGIFNDNGDGTGRISFTPNYNHSAVYPDITVIATDDGVFPPALSDTVTFTLTVDSVNRSPVIEPIADQNNYILRERYQYHLGKAG